MVLLLLVGSTGALAQNATERTFEFDIPRQPADTALTEFAEQADLTLVFPAELVRGKFANELVGTYTLQEGIDFLLEGTGLVPTFRNAIVLSIAAADPPANGGGDVETTKKSGLVALLAGIFAGGVGAQETGTVTEVAEQPLPIEEIIVTGSHIRGAPNTASPVLRFDRDTIMRSGFSTLDEFIESIPQNFGGGASQDTIGTDSAVGNNGFGSSVNLRALGPGSSLVLVNGRRLAPAGNGGRFIDVSMLPMAAIERVDVLTDGASAIYGSDAVGGVVNFILRDDYEGAQTMLRYGSVTHGDLSDIQASQALGAQWDSGSTLLAYEYHSRDALYAGDRAFAESSESPRSLLPEQDRHSVYANLRQELGDRVVLSGDALYSTREAFNQNAFLGLQVDERSDNDQFQASLGTDVEISTNWNLNVSTSYSEYQFDATRLETPVGATDGSRTETNVGTDVWSFDALAEGLLMELPGGGLRLAAGGSFRKENVQPVFSEALPEREVTAAFGELFIPLFGPRNKRPGLEALELSLAARYEDYSDFGSDVTPKVGVRWSPVEGLALRGTYGESFKAPVLTDLAPGTEALLAFVASDFGLAIDGDPLILLRAQSALPDLKEEESSSYTLGFDVGRDEGLSLSMTWYHIEFEGRIGTPLDGGFEAFFNSPDVYGQFQVLNPDSSFVDARLADATVFTDLSGGLFTPSTVDIWADVAVTNIAVEEQSGIDFLVRYPLETGAGRFEMSLNGTYITTFDKQLAPEAPTVEALNLLNAPMDLRLRSSVVWNRENLSAALFVNYMDDYRNTDAEASHISSWTTLDSQLSYDFDRSAGGFLSGLSLSLSVQNLLDRDPPFVASQGSPIAHPGYDSTNATPLGRFVALTATKSWQ
ncbi:MAG TPA: TonB-dependent receptor [Woeseiaceae bacterium]